LFWLSRLSSGWVALLEGDFNMALEQARLVADLSGEELVPVFWLGVFAATAQRTEEASQRLTQVIESEQAAGPLRTVSTMLEAILREDVVTIRQELATMDFLEAAKVDWTFCWLLADVFTQIGEPGEALRWLENALELGFTNHRFFSTVDPFLTPLHTDARFQELMERMRERQRALET
jgi:hypothetical protein